MAKAKAKGGAGPARKLLVPPKRLRWRVPAGAIPADPTAGSDTTVGQARALEALRLGLEVRAAGYNLYVSGITGTGRTTTVLQMVKQLAPSCPVPRDRAYVHNFGDMNRPRLLTLVAGRASALKKDVEDLVGIVRRTLPASVEDREFLRRRDEIMKRYAVQESKLLDGFRSQISKDGFALVEIAGEQMKRLEIFFVVEADAVPLDRYKELAAEGKVPKETVEEREARFLEHRRELAQILRQDRVLAREMNDEVGSVLKEAVRGNLTGTFEDLRARYPEEAVGKFLQEMEEDILDNIVPLAREAVEAPEGDGHFRAYVVHVLVDRRGLKGCPMVHETAPTVAGIFGNIERRQIAPGVFVADHTMIRPGSLLEADGGFLILAAEDVLSDGGVAAHLRRVLKHRRLEIRSVESPQGLAGLGLSPEAIDLDVKVILVGDWRIYESLYRSSTEFAETFRVKAEFEPDMDASPPNLRHFCRVSARVAAKAGILPVARAGFEALLEHGVRASGRQGKITTRFSEVGEVLREANYWASMGSAREIAAAHVRKAIDRMAERNRLAESRVQELIERGVLMVETKGRRAGRVNGLSVYDLGYYAFGKPTVITASTGVGRAGIINVEREARLSGGIYDKGVLIIAGYLRRTFAQERPLALSASVCFEQSYSGVDGDSASVAEVAALASELSGVPVDQGIAVTGSLNQHGDVQPIGGVNEKIEGFYQVCRRRGLTGAQGVVIPRANVGDLMLAQEIVDACAAGKFHVWSVARVEEALGILLGEEVGVRGRGGAWTPGSIYAKVDARLLEYTARLSGTDDWKPIPSGEKGSAQSPPVRPVGPDGDEEGASARAPRRKTKRR